MTTRQKVLRDLVILGALWYMVYSYLNQALGAHGAQVTATLVALAATFIACRVGSRKLPKEAIDYILGFEHAAVALTWVGIVGFILAHKAKVMLIPMYALSSYLALMWLSHYERKTES